MAEVDANAFYFEYFGHDVRLLKRLHDELRQPGGRGCLFLAGDSSLDNNF